MAIEKHPDGSVGVVKHNGDVLFSFDDALVETSTHAGECTYDISLRTRQTDITPHYGDLTTTERPTRVSIVIDRPDGEGDIVFDNAIVTKVEQYDDSASVEAFANQSHVQVDDEPVDDTDDEDDDGIESVTITI